jgi:hypothetical protein
MEIAVKQWESYELVGTFLLDQFARKFGLDCVEGKQQVHGQRSKTSWIIDAKGVRLGADGFVVIEFRRYTTSRLDQEALGGLAYRISDCGAKGGIIVSPLGLQEGAEKVAMAENVTNVILNQDCDRQQYIMKFLNELMIGFHDGNQGSEKLEIVVFHKDGTVERSGGDSGATAEQVW